MTKEEIKQRFFGVISAKLNYSMKIDEIKDLAEAFKVVCEIDDKDNFLKQLADQPLLQG